MHNNPFDLPRMSNQARVMDMATTSLGRLDSMTSQLTLKPSIETILCQTQANLELLYIKAKKLSLECKRCWFPRRS